MGKVLLGIAMFLTLSVGNVATVSADEAEECKGLVEKAAAMWKEKGKDQTLKSINDPNGPFVRGNLYTFALTMNNVVLAHPRDKSLIRMRLNTLTDANGTPVFVRFGEVAGGKGSGWVEYTWNKPGEKEPSPKRTFIKSMPEEDVYFGAGYYLK